MTFHPDIAGLRQRAQIHFGNRQSLKETADMSTRIFLAALAAAALGACGVDANPHSSGSPSVATPAQPAVPPQAETPAAAPTATAAAEPGKEATTTAEPGKETTAAAESENKDAKQAAGEKKSD
jgi:hypothetical protein